MGEQFFAQPARERRSSPAGVLRANRSAAAGRLRERRNEKWGADRCGERTLACARAFLGDMALRDDAAPTPSRHTPARSGRCTAGRVGGYSQAIADTLRQPV